MQNVKKILLQALSAQCFYVRFELGKFLGFESGSGIKETKVFGVVDQDMIDQVINFLSVNKDMIDSKKSELIKLNIEDIGDIEVIYTKKDHLGFHFYFLPKGKNLSQEHWKFIQEHEKEEELKEKSKEEKEIVDSEFQDMFSSTENLEEKPPVEDEKNQIDLQNDVENENLDFENILEQKDFSKEEKLSKPSNVKSL